MNTTLVSILVVLLAVGLVTETQAWWYGSYAGLGFGYGGLYGFGSPYSYYSYPYYSYGYPYSWRKRDVSGDLQANATVITYIKEKSVLSVQRPTEIVMCQAAFIDSKMPSNYDMFALGQFNTSESIADLSLSLYPQFNGSVYIDGSAESWALYSSDKFDGSLGFKVKDAACFQKVVDFFVQVPFFKLTLKSGVETPAVAQIVIV